MTDLFVSYAQNYEDVYLWRALKHVERGCYIDVGAYDPTNDSVTRAFYERGWRGANLEPTQACFDRLRQARPEDINLNVAAGSAEGSITLYEVSGTGMSTSVYENALRAQQIGFSFNAVEVPVTTLDKVWEDSSLHDVHFLKIDVEGDEESVLRGLNFSRHRPWIIVIESMIPNSSEQSFASWEDLVLNADYAFASFDGLNRYYFAKEHPELSGRLSTPPNFFDFFVRASEVEARQEAERLRKAEQSLQGQMEELQGRIEELQDRMEALQGHMEELQRDNELLRGTLTTVCQSRSWRYTAPLRLAKTVLAPKAWLGVGSLFKNPRRTMQGVGRWALNRSALRRLGKGLLPWHTLRWRIRRFLLATEGDKVVRLTASLRNGRIARNENRSDEHSKTFSITECRQAIDVAELKARIHREMECHKTE